MQSLLIDVGNTSAKYAIYDEESGEIEVFAYSQARLVISRVNKILCSTVSANNELSELLTLTSITPTFIETQANAFGIKNAYPSFNNLGVDRWLAIIGGEACYPGNNLIIVDAGTAMTIDALDEKKNHLGGWIVPGLNLMQSSIADKAPGVFTKFDAELEQFGTDTPSALYSGCVYSLVGLIDTAVSMLRAKEPYATVKVLLTGGDGPLLLKHLDNSAELIPDLVFKGLARFSTKVK